MEQRLKRQDLDRYLWLLLVLIIALATLLRIYHLDSQSFWIDEGYSVWAAQTFSSIDPATSYSADTPLYPFVLRQWMRLFDTDFGIRLLSVIFGVAAVPIIFFLGRSAFNNTVGITSALFLALSPFHIKYSQEVRVFSIFFFFLLFAIYMIVKLAKEEKMVYWLGYVLSGALMLYSHGTAAFYLVLLNIFFLILGWPPNVHVLKKWILANMLIVLLFLPWMTMYLIIAKNVVSGWWAPTPTPGDLINTVVSFTALSIPPPAEMLRARFGIPIGFQVPSIVWSLSFIGLFLYGLYAAIRFKKKELLAFIAFLIGAIGGMYIISLTIQPIYGDRLLLPALISVSFLVTSPLLLITSKIHRKFIVLLLIISFFILTLSGFYYFRYPTKQNWKGATEHIYRAHKDQDLIIFNTNSDIHLFIFERYLPDKDAEIPKLHITDMIGYVNKTVNPGDIASLIERIPSAKRIWLVLSHVKSIDPEGLVLSWFEQHYRAVDRLRFNGLKVNLYAARDM
ncbi:MAG: glycosyltransferase family 39 protein [Proteobacteria bacterium]|nr:glycosyltransferase family 39 protein [Pseudomonadota bacterium]